MKKIFFLLCYLFVNMLVTAQVGSIDLTFNPSDTGFGNGDDMNGLLNVIVRQDDGKFLLGGTFTKYNGKEVNYLTRINPDGTIDETFAESTTTGAAIYSLCLLPDGKIIVAGYFTSFNGVGNSMITRLNADGTNDLTFNPGIGANERIYNVTRQPDGKLIIAGNFTSYNGVSRAYIARLNSDGSLDLSFNPGTGFDALVNSFELQSDGKIVCGGAFTTFNGNASNYICRLNSDGSFDSGYNVGTGLDSYVYTTMMQSDGKVIVGGNFNFFNGSDKYYLLRLNTDGTLDNTFNIGTGPNWSITNIFADGDKIFIQGSVSIFNGTPVSNFFRLNADGTIDNTFDSGSGVAGSLASFCKLPDGKFLVGGWFTEYNGVPRGSIAMVNADGSNYNNFLTGSGANAFVNSVSVANDGKVIVGGYFSKFNGQNHKYFTLLNNDGTVDAAFVPSSFLNNLVYTSCFQSDGDILLGGLFSYYGSNPSNKYTRIKRNGSHDIMFDVETGANGNVRNIKVLSDGKSMIVGEFTHYKGNNCGGVARVNSDGTYDNTFTPGTGTNGKVYDVAVQSDGKVIIGGAFTFYNGVARKRIARLNTDGTLDATFNPVIGPNDTVYTVLIQSDGKIIIGGSFTSYNGTSVSKIARLNTDGTIDNSYNFGSGANGTIYDAIMQANDKVVVVGSFTSFNGDLRNRIARINTDGSLDPSFDVGDGANQLVRAIALQADGNIIIGGSFTSYDNTGKNRVARIIGGEDPIVLNTVNPAVPNICQGDALTIDYTVSHDLNSSNVFSAQLSDASGSFAAPITIGTVVSNTSGSINVIIPISQTAGSNYRIRVVASNPVIIGNENSNDIAINSSTSSIITVTACETYTAPDGVIYTSSGLKTAVIPNSVGCDSIISINLTITNNTSNTITIAQCYNYTAPDGAFYTTSGIKTAIIPNSEGCDSIITINLTILQNTSSTITVSECFSYTAPDGIVYTSSGIKTAVIPNSVGCDSIITINLTINQNTISTITESSCDSYTAPDGVIYTTSGVKTAIIPNAAGCDSTITINLTILQSTSSSFSVSQCDSYLAPDGVTYTTSGIKTAIIPNFVGCDSIIAIDLTILESTSSFITVSECNSYLAPDGVVYTSSGIKTAIIPNAAGCDSVITINLTINQNTASTITVSECNSYTAPDGVIYTTSGVKTAIIPNAAGCDSTITINLTILQSTSLSFTVSQCDSYLAPDGVTYTTSGIKTAIIPNFVGCDSIIAIDLTILESTSSFITVSECNSYLAPDGVVYTSSGIKTAIIPNAAGCDSVITIDLTILQSSSSNITVSSCTSYVAPDGQIYTYSGIVTAIIPNSVGCDSIITIDLTILEASFNTFDVYACDSYTAPDGVVYYASGMVSAIIPNQTNGCDSVMMINLFMRESTSSEITVVACDLYTAPDNTIYTESGVYTAVVFNSAGCDSVITINLTINQSLYAGSDFSGSHCSNENPVANLFDYIGSDYEPGGIWYDANETGYMDENLFYSTNVEQGLTYVFYYVVSPESPCSADTATVSLYVDICEGIAQEQNNDFVIYPNPVQDILNVSSDFDFANTSYCVYDAIGKIVLQGSLNREQSLLIDMLEPGLYVISFNQGGLLLQRKFIKK